MRRHVQDVRFGQLFVPGGNSPAMLNGRPWAIDNRAFSGFDVGAFLALLRQFRAHRRGCLFVTCPDVVCDAKTTMDLFDFWRPIIALGLMYPVAFVAQDGQERGGTPWNLFDALFIGGSTEWKLSSHAANLIGIAKARGKWVHMGRVNTRRRLRIAMQMGVDSVDGTAISKWGNVFVPKFQRWMTEIKQQPSLQL